MKKSYFALGSKHPKSKLQNFPKTVKQSCFSIPKL